MDLDWTLLRAVLAVAETGSLSGAATELSLTQPTLGRQIKAAEQALGQPLFTRHARGLTPTPFCDSLLPAARRMRDAAQAVSVLAAGQSPDTSGRVRLTASVFVTSHVLPDILATIREDHPNIALDVVASDATENLLFHEADIALRMYRPTQLDMITKHLGDLSLGLYASERYIARHGLLRDMDDLHAHQMVGYDRSDLILRGMRAMGMEVTRDWFTVCTDDQVAYWKFVAAGCGIGIGQTVVAERTPGVRRILSDLTIPPLPVWLTAHPSLRHQPRVAAVWTALDQAISPLLS
ncbi:LysR family transcriptional regulator [Rhodobacteraceae bacterium N5(2021)]|uniref:LysR family transcriptional regulator n=1 Tax=Gymnodinialimonas phycosphaerae TaxID=2841589 RepID=A0A975TSK0_9RHOB|nr:LysR family transcriptional regulator [Gymnodinialimonas phycosphaerae]MBY4894200.1 LysR family transcriptional regulator [Gymnodinialimonas phycosphaerae]